MTAAVILIWLACVVMAWVMVGGPKRIKGEPRCDT